MSSPGPFIDEQFSWRLWQSEDDIGNDDADGDLVYADPNVPRNELVVRDVLHPRCFAFAPDRSNGRAVLILGGGGYTQLMIGKEGFEVAQWLTSLGFHAFVLAHRFPSERWARGNSTGAQAPLDDAIEAMRQIRAQAPRLGIDPQGVGVLGLSSGGHLASCLIARYPEQWHSPASANVPLRAAPDFLIIGYAPISTNALGRTVVANKKPLPPPEKQALYDALQPDIQLLDSPPPTFIVYSADDDVVPVENARRLHAAIEAKGTAAELHIFAKAPHGFALRESGLPVGVWPQLCSAWLSQLILKEA